MNYVPFYVRLEHRSKSMTRKVSKPSQNISKDTVETVYIIQWCILRSVHWATNCTNMYIPAKSYKERVFRLFRQSINVNAHKKLVYVIRYHSHFLRYQLFEWVLFGDGLTKIWNESFWSLYFEYILESPPSAVDS